MYINLNIYQTMMLVSIIFYIGNYLRDKLTIISKYCIPPAVVGGFLFALLTLIFNITGIITLSLDTTLQDIFMTAFFTSIGFISSIKALKKGGIKVATFLGLSILLVTLQNTIGVTLASLFNLTPLLGLCTGSIPMVGGHGTSGSFGPILEGLGVSGATTVSIASATFGLIMGSIIGGLVARTLIVRHNLSTINYEGIQKSSIQSNDFDEEDSSTLSYKKLMSGALLLFVAMGFGSIISNSIQNIGFTFPSYIGAMLIASIIRNIYDFAHKDFAEKEVESLGSISLSFFLTMALMNLRLWELFDLALPLVFMLLAQVLLTGLFSYFIVFKVMGKNYEAAVFSSATCGFGMGATPNALANMDELTNKYGLAPTPYFVVPIVGCLFIDFANSAIITIFINLLS